MRAQYQYIYNFIYFLHQNTFLFKFMYCCFTVPIAMSYNGNT